MIIYIFKEKWDSMTRKWKDNCLLQLVRLFLIDEVSVFVTYFAHRTVFGCYFLPLYFPAQWGDALATLCLRMEHSTIAHN